MAIIKDAIAALGYRGAPKRSRGRPRKPSYAIDSARAAVREVDTWMVVLRKQSGRIHGTLNEAIALVSAWRGIDEDTLRNLHKRPKKDKRR